MYQQWTEHDADIITHNSALFCIKYDKKVSIFKSIKKYKCKNDSASTALK